ncbi:hypothetical protein H0E84_09275 [Luteimonas sp. SJ-92]|uniref:DUF2268 domain-containing protein n=1 Tax=Luteimonas salinisoli TaxID=2752307 RepID=A0A853JCK5_9GAMM|nr:DUF2268 domain-containing putative Zn-dependent protease [Luteimonas salinisoli]NZA26575.1 hypothetical protein [Luteimonas salinisoli]
MATPTPWSPTIARRAAAEGRMTSGAFAAGGVWRILPGVPQRVARMPSKALQLLLVLAWSLAFGAGLACTATAGPRENRDPDAAGLVTEDLPRFWAAWNEAAQTGDRAQRVAAFQRGYLDRGTPGLEAFTRLRIHSADRLVSAIDEHPRYYASLRGSGDLLEAQKPAIREALRSMAAVYPGGVFPDVYFLIGRMNSGGTLDEAGLLIGLEMYGRGDGVPLGELGEWHRAVVGELANLPDIVAHEWVHFQQSPEVQDQPTLLRAALREGVADFLSELGTGRHINQHVHAWAEPRAAGLWAEFAQMMDGSDYTGWLYDTQAGDGRPADLGYWMGYRIARAYYRRAADKREAIRDMLRIEDAAAFLEASGVTEEFERSGRAGERKE